MVEHWPSRGYGQVGGRLRYYSFDYYSYTALEGSIGIYYGSYSSDSVDSRSKGFNLAIYFRR